MWARTLFWWGLGLAISIGTGMVLYRLADALGTGRPLAWSAFAAAWTSLALVVVHMRRTALRRRRVDRALEALGEAFEQMQSKRQDIAADVSTLVAHLDGRAGRVDPPAVPATEEAP